MELINNILQLIKSIGAVVAFYFATIFFMVLAIKEKKKIKEIKLVVEKLDKQLLKSQTPDADKLRISGHEKLFGQIGLKALYTHMGILLFWLGSLWLCDVLADMEVLVLNDLIDDFMFGSFLIWVGFAVIYICCKVMSCENYQYKGDFAISGIVDRVYQEKDRYPEDDKKKTLLPRYRRVYIRYIGRYDEQQYFYLLKKKVNLKKHPIGSVYPLQCSKRHGTVYANNEHHMHRKGCFLAWAAGIVLIVSGIFRMIPIV